MMIMIQILLTPKSLVIKSIYKNITYIFVNNMVVNRTTRFVFLTCVAAFGAAFILPRVFLPAKIPQKDLFLRWF